jgi:hypothetical protein
VVVAVFMGGSAEVSEAVVLAAFAAARLAASAAVDLVVSADSVGASDVSAVVDSDVVSESTVGMVGTGVITPTTTAIISISSGRRSRQVGWLLALEDAIDVCGCARVLLGQIRSIGDQPTVVDEESRILAPRRSLRKAGFVEGQTLRSNIGGRTVNMIDYRHWHPIWLCVG